MSSFNIEVASPVSPARLFKAAVLDWHKLGPQLVPEIYATAAAVQGSSPAVGSTRKHNLTQASPFSHVKDRLDYVDHDKFESKTTLVEVGPIVSAAHKGSNIDSEMANKTFHVKIEPTPSGGSIYKVVVTSKTVGPNEEGLQAKINELITGEIKAVEAYLLANPTAYA